MGEDKVSEGMLNIPDKLDIGPAQKNAYGDRSFYNLNPNTFKEVHAAALLDKEFSKILFEESTFYFIVGTDSGLLPHYLQNKGLPDGSRYIFIEPDGILHALNLAHALPDVDERIAFSTEDELLQVMRQLNSPEYFVIDAVKVYFALGVQEDTTGIYAELNFKVTEKIQLERLYHLSATHKEPFMIQQLNNVSETQYPASMLTKAFIGKTAFILGGGPSLDDALDWVKQHRQYLVILAVSRIVVRLLEVGIEPDFIISLDPYPVNFEVSRGIFSLSRKPVFIFGNHVWPSLIHQWPGRKIYLGKRVPWASKMNLENIEPIGPTVSNTAFAVAYHFGFSRIYLAGVDFCYTAEGFTHAKGTDERAAGPSFTPDGLAVETYAGNMAPVNVGFAFARDLFEKQINSLKSSHCEFANVSLHAAKVNGVSYVPLSSIKIDSEPVDVEAVLDCSMHYQDPVTFFSTLIVELNRALHQLKRIKRVAQEALAVNESMYHDGIITQFSDKLRHDKLQRSLDIKYRNFSLVVREFAVRSFLKMAKPKDDFDNITAEHVQDAFRIYYTSYVDGATRLVDLLEKVKQRVLARKEEHKDNPNWDLIIEQSREDQCFGRVRVWNTLTSCSQIRADLQNQFKEFEHLFDKKLTEKVANAEKVKGLSDLSLIKTRASSLFKLKQSPMLHNLLLSVDQHPDKEKAVIYQCLIKGYLAELENKPEEAINWYKQVLEYNNGPEDHALLRMAYLYIGLGSVHLAHQILERLSQLDKRYLLIFAQSSYLLGQIPVSLNAFLAYWSAFPEDLVVQLKLAQIYLDIGSYEGAKTMLDYILQHNPEQEAALIMVKQLEPKFGS